MKTLLTLFWLLLLVCLSPAREVKLEWDPNPEPDVSGYFIRWRLDSSTTWTQTATQAHPKTTITIPDLPNQLLHFQAFAQNEAGLVSEGSNIVSEPPSAPGAPQKLRTAVVVTIKIETP